MGVGDGDGDGEKVLRRGGGLVGREGDGERRVWMGTELIEYLDNMNRKNTYSSIKYVPRKSIINI